MQIEKSKYKIKCDMGLCKNKATHSIITARSGIKSRLSVCEQCLKELASLINSEFTPPKSIETAKKKKTSE